MKKYIFTIIFSLLTLNVTAQQNKDSIPNNTDSIHLFAHEVSKSDYYAAWKYIEGLKKMETIPDSILWYMGTCYNNLYKNLEFIEFCDEYITTHPKQANYIRLCKGVSYYDKFDYQQTLKNLEEYIKYSDKHPQYKNWYILQIYANSLYHTQNYIESGIYYKQYFDEISKIENINIEQFPDINDLYFLGNDLYLYAYTQMLQGKEKYGQKLLKIAARCGHTYAQEDLIVLEKSATFAKDIKYKRKTIREFKKILGEMDVCGKIPKCTPQSFWHDFQAKNPRFQNLMQKLHKKKIPSSLKNANDELQSAKTYIYTRLQKLHPHDPGFLEYKLKESICDTYSFISEIRTYPSSSVNAFATPFGEIYLTDAIKERYHYNNTLLIGVCAHEATHYLCHHSLVGLWQQNRKERKNNILSNIAVGVNTAIHVAAGIYTASNGVSTDDDYWIGMNSINSNLIDSFDANTYNFQFKYNRGQELEADITAYRFCEAMGLGGYAYIIALELLGDSQTEMKSSKIDDHPTTSFRIGLLKYLYSIEHTDSENYL